MLILVIVLLVAVVAVAAVATSRTGRGPVARVHVDDLATGRLPGVCAVTGAPTTNLVAVESARGGIQAWWLLLILLGPLGLAVLAVLVVLGRRTERVGGLLPISPAAVEHYNAAMRTARNSMIGLVAVAVLGVGSLAVLSPGSSTVGFTVLGLGAAFLFVCIGASIVAPTRWIDLSLDASGRWVTVDRAHPDFGAALFDHNRRADVAGQAGHNS